MDLNVDENIEWLMESSKTVENLDCDFERTERESMELCRFLEVLRNAFESEPILVESKARGTIKSEEEVHKLIKNLKVLGYFFSIRTSERKGDRQNCKLMIMNKKTPPSSHPYRVLSHIRYYCSQKQTQREESSLGKEINKSRRITNCKAILDVRQIEIFTKVSLPTIRRKRIELLKNFRRGLLSKSHLEGETKYAVIVSLPKIHIHPVEVKGHYLNDEVKAAMHYVLRSGATSLKSIQEKIYQIVDREFEEESIKPSRENSAFYPNLKTIYNHLRRDGLARKTREKTNAQESSDLNEAKRKTKDLLNSIVERVENCTDSKALNEFYKRCMNFANASTRSAGTTPMAPKGVRIDGKVADTWI